jgi:hypothetical protein
VKHPGKGRPISPATPDHPAPTHLLASEDTTEELFPQEQQEDPLPVIDPLIPAQQPAAGHQVSGKPSSAVSPGVAGEPEPIRPTPGRKPTTDREAQVTWGDDDLSRTHQGVERAKERPTLSSGGSGRNPVPPPPISPAPDPDLAANEVEISAPEVASQPVADVQSSAAVADSTPVADDTSPALPDLVPIDDLVVGERTTFNSKPWWTPMKWTRMPEAGTRSNDVHCASGVGSGIAAAACSIRGKRHRQHGEPNEDAFSIGMIPVDEECEFLVAVVCDGMGSADFSHYGSQRVADLMAVTLRELIDETQVRDIATLDVHLRKHTSKILEKVSNEALNSRPEGLSLFARSVPPAGSTAGEIQTTLTFVVVQNLAGSDKPPAMMDAIVGMIGDSPALHITQSGPQPLDVPEDAQGVFSTATVGAVGASQWQLFRTTVSQDRPLLIATDGVANYLSHQGSTTPLGRYVSRRWIQPLPILEFVRDTSFDLASADDDRTAIMIWPQAGR